MKRLITAFLVLASALFAAPTVSNIRTAFVSHSDFQMIFDVSAPYNGLRIRYINAPGTCTGGIGGTIQVFPIGAIHTTSNMVIVLAGLTPGATVNFCPEVSDDGGSSWSSGVGSSQVMPALPSPHPQPPIAPLTIDTSPPNTAGYSNLLVGTDCTLDACISTALTNQCSNGTIIKIPVGTTISSTGIYFLQESCDTKKFHLPDVSTSTSEITYANHGLSEGQPMQFTKVYGALTSYPDSNSCHDGTGLVNGQTFYAHPTGTNTFRVYCPDKTTLMVFTTQGNLNGNPNFYFGFAGQPRTALNWIIIRTSSPDSELPPPGSRITPIWTSKMATLQEPNTELNRNAAWLVFGDSDGNNSYMISHVQIGPGIRIAPQDSTEAHTSSDPSPYIHTITTYAFTSNIVFRQTYFDMPSPPNRFTANFFWDGYGQAIIDSYTDDALYYHSMNGTSAAQTSSTVATITGGVVNGGSGNITVPTFTATIGGSGTGHVRLFLDMLNGNALTYTHPTGVTVSCSVTCLNGGISQTGGDPGDGTCFNWFVDNNTGHSGRDGWPADSLGNPTSIGIGCIDVSGTTITAVQTAEITTSEYNTEGSSYMIAGAGPGPYANINSYFSGAGITIHHDDGGGNTYVRGDYTYYHCAFNQPFNRMWSNPLSDGLRYFNRQPLEWKSGQRLNIYGCIFDGAWSEDSPVSGFITLTSVAGQGITDVNIHDNTFMHGPTIIQGLSQVYGGAILTQPANRMRLANNLGWDINVNGPNFGGRYTIDQTTNGAKGWLTQGPQGTEDWIIDHNTVVGANGQLPSLFWTQGVNTEGMQVTNNILYLWSGSQGAEQEGGTPTNACVTLLGAALANCTFTPSYNITNNLFQSGDGNQATVQGWWPGGTNFIPSNMSLSSVGWYVFSQTSPNNFHLLNTSAYISGGSNHANDGEDMGANITQLERMEGHVEAYNITGITSTAAQANFNAPDSQSCPIYLATSPWPTTSAGTIPTFTIVSDPNTNVGPRHLSLGTLTTQQTYYAKLMCATEQPELRFKTN